VIIETPDMKCFQVGTLVGTENYACEVIGEPCLSATRESWKLHSSQFARSRLSLRSDSQELSLMYWIEKIMSLGPIVEREADVLLLPDVVFPPDGALPPDEVFPADGIFPPEEVAFVRSID
jgi:hypothetical protein